MAVLKEKLTRLRMTGVKLVDADLLLAQLQMVVGEKDELGDAMKKEEAQAALDELKKNTRRHELNPPAAQTVNGDMLDEYRRSGVPVLRIYEPAALCAVLGAAGKPEQDLLLDALERDGVPWMRRRGGGGTVVLGPGAGGARRGDGGGVPLPKPRVRRGDQLAGSSKPCGGSR